MALFIKIFIGCGLATGFIIAIWRDWEVNRILKMNEAAIDAAIVAQQEAAHAEYIRLSKELEGIRYQLNLLGLLDNQIDHTSRDEKELKKALSLEKQTFALWKKERAIMDKMEKLGY